MNNGNNQQPRKSDSLQCHGAAFPWESQEQWADVWVYPQTSSALRSISKSQSLGQKLPENLFPHVQQQTWVTAFLT